MILKALADYYDRLADDPSVDVAPPGFERKSVDFAVVIGADGAFQNLRDLREGAGKKRQGAKRLIPRSVKRAAGIASNLLWDTAPYALGIALPEKNKDIGRLQERAVVQHKAFIDRLLDLAADCDDLGLKALLSFLQNNGQYSVIAHPEWPTVETDGGG